MSGKHFIGAVFCFFCFSGILYSGSVDVQGISLSTEVSETKVPLNKTVQLVIKVEWAGDSSKYSFNFPPSPDLNRFEIVGSSSSNRKFVKEGQPYAEKMFVYVLRPLEEGTGSIGGISFEYENQESSTKELLQTQSFEIEILPPEIPFWDRTRKFIVPAVLIVCFVIVMIAAASWVKKRKKSRATRDETPVASTEEIYLTRLKELDSLIPVGETSKFYSELFDCFRGYLQDGHGISLPTGEVEMDKLLESIGIDNSFREKLMKLLKTCDLVKFAGMRPSTGEMKESLNVLGNFIETVSKNGNTLLKGANNSS